MVLSVPVIALGATLGTATSILALCGVTCLCRHMHPKKGLLKRDRDPDPEKARPGVLRSAQQVSGGGASASRARWGLGGGCGGGGTGWGELSPFFAPLSVAGRRAEDVLEDPPRGPYGLGVGEGSGRIVRGGRLGEGARGMGSPNAKGKGRGWNGNGDWGTIGAGRRVERLGGNQGRGVWGVRSLQNWGTGEGREVGGFWCRESTDLTEEGESHGKTEKTRGEVVAAPVGAGEGQLGRECLGSRERLVNLEGFEGPLPPPSSPQLQPARGACCGLSEDVPGERRAFIPGVGLYPEPLGTGNGWSPHCTVRQKGSREEVWKEPPT